MNLILSLFVFTFSLIGHFTSRIHQTYKDIICDTTILEINSLIESGLIDTTLHFNNKRELAHYKHKNDSLFSALIRSNNKISPQIKEKLDYDNSIRFHKLIYKYLSGCNKNIQENFDLLVFVLKDYRLFSQEQLLSLYNLFPEKLKNSKEGKTYLATINGRPDNIGHSIFGAGDISFESAEGALVPLPKLVDGDHQFYIILFTASWCGPCRYYANVFRSDLDKLDKNQVKVISISIDKSRSQWLKYLKEESYAWSSYRAMTDWNSKIMNYLHFEAVPNYLLIDRKGIIIDEQTGPVMKEIINKIKQNAKM
jgi:thiol-disulfide isomerase/thioredoxin